MARPRKQATLGEVKGQLIQGLRQAALRPTIAGYVPQEHQIKFHASTSKGRLFIGGNRSGKTVGGGAESVFWLTGQHPYPSVCNFRPPIRGRIVAVDFLQGVSKIVMPEIAKWTPPSMLINGSWEDSYDKQERTLHLSNGSFVEFMSYDQDTDKFAGTSRHFTWFDEEPPEHIFNECMMRLVDTGGSWWVTMTPVEDMTWTYDGLYNAAKDGKRPDIAVFEVSSTDNKYISGAELEILMSGMNEDEKQARMHGKYMRQSNTIYGPYLHNKTFIPDIIDNEDWEFYQKKWMHFAMMDSGWANPTCFLFGCADIDGRVIIYDEYYKAKRVISEHSEAVRAIIEEHGVVPEYIVGDPAIAQVREITGTSVQMEYAEHGINIMPGNNDVTAGINRVAMRFQNRKLYITERCVNLRWELNRYRWAKFTSKKIAERSNLKETPLKKDDHAMDALRYGIVSRPALAGEEELSVGNFLNFPSAVMLERKALIPSYSDVPSEEYFDDMLGLDW